MSKPDNPIDDVKDLAAYVRGMADAMQNTRLSDAAAWLERLSNRVCAGNVIGCRGGRDCTSDHK